MKAPDDQRRNRSAATKARLLRFGCRVFAERGFAATTTRMLAEAARVNQASIPYHFGGKEGLYMAVAEEIAARGRLTLKEQLAWVRSPEGAPSASAGRDALQVFLRRMVRGFMAIAGDDGSAAAFIVREQASPGPAFELLYDGYIQPMHAHAAALVAAAVKRSSSNPKVVLATHAIIGMVLVFVTARETMLRRMQWTVLNANRIERIESVIGTLTDGALDEFAATFPGRASPQKKRAA